MAPRGTILLLVLVFMCFHAAVLTALQTVELQAAAGTAPGQTALLQWSQKKAQAPLKVGQRVSMIVHGWGACAKGCRVKVTTAAGRCHSSLPPLPPLPPAAFGVRFTSPPNTYSPRAG